VTHLAGLEYARLLLAAAAVARFAILWMFATGVGDVDVRDPEAGLSHQAPA
jgi:hypothetical protein